MTETADIEPVVEEWRNEGRAKLGIVRFDRDGHEDLEYILGGQAFLITTSERKRNQRKVVLPKYDPFTNGQCRLIGGLPADDPEYAALVNQPDAIDDGRITALLDGRVEDFETAVMQMTSETTLRRVLMRGEEEGAAGRRLNFVRDRLAGLDRRSPMRGDSVTDGDPEQERNRPVNAPLGEDDGQAGPRRYEIDNDLAFG